MFYFNLFKANLATERERQLTKGKRTKRTERDLRCSICRFAIGQAVFFLFARVIVSVVALCLLNLISSNLDESILCLQIIFIDKKYILCTR